MIRLLSLLLLFFLLGGTNLHARTPMSRTGSVEGAVLDPANGRPLAGVTVLLSESGKRTVTDSQGRFVLGGVPAGECRLVFFLAGRQLVAVPDVAVNAGQSLKLELELPERGEDFRDIHFLEAVEVPVAMIGR